MAVQVPRDHHYVPQFYLRQFASNTEKTKIKTIARNGEFAVFAERSIKTLGYERDFYVHRERGVPVNVEAAINSRVETPISESETWRKIASNSTEQLDATDKAVLYALIRHLEARGPHARQISKELAQLAADPNSEIPFTLEERRMYAEFRRNPHMLRRLMNKRAVSVPWTERDFHRSSLSIVRSPIALRTSTSPVMTLSAPDHPALHLPLPGQTPYCFALALNPNTLAILALGDFNGAFSNSEMPLDAATMFNRQNVINFAKFTHVRHIVADDDRLVQDMTLAPFDLLESRHGHMRFKRRAERFHDGDSPRP